MNPRDDYAAKVGTGAAQEKNYQRQANRIPEFGALQAPKPLNPGTKRAAILRAFLEVGADGMNCFTAALRYGDFVLRTTVSECSRYHGIAFHKRFEQVPGRNGSKVECVRYSLTPEGATKTRELLGAA